MALAILDGTQTATTLSTILSSGQHITAHTVVSLGTQAITDMRSAVSGSVVSISSLPAISGTVTANAGANFAGEIYNGIFNFSENTQMGVYVTDQLPTGTNSIGRVTVAGTVTIGAGTAQIGSVTASISNFPATQAISISSVTVGNSVTIGSLPAITGTVTANVFGSNGSVQIPLQMAYSDEAFINGNRLAVSIVNSEGQEYTTPLPISGTVTANTFAVQGTAVTTSNFTSTTASTVLANYNAAREVLTIFNEGAGNLHIAPGATCTTIAYQVRLSAGDYFEVPSHQTTITHSAVYATAGTARICQLS